MMMLRFGGPLQASRTPGRHGKTAGALSRPALYALSLSVCREPVFACRAPRVRASVESASTLTTPREAPPAADAAASSAGPQAFSWTSRWWPVYPLDSLNPKIPMHVDLLGKSLVVWGDGAGAWHCLEDKCPHRLAPLSEGRVEQGQIMCCYHGWTFSGTGACTSIPQLAGDSKAHASACSSKRSCVDAYPTRAAHGLLWVWPEAGSEAALRAAATAPVALLDEGCMPWYIRDIPVRYDVLLENVYDPSHVPYAHHGVMGNRDQPTSWAGAVTCSAVTVDGLVGSNTTPRGQQNVEFLAPFLVKYTFNGQLLGPQIIVVPTKPGWSRLMLNFAKPATLASRLRLPPLVSLLMQLRMGLGIPALDHIWQRNAVFDGDNYTLHLAERLLPPSRGLGSDAASQAYYMPSPVDGLASGLRRWMQDYGAAIPTCSPEDEAAMPAAMPKEQVLDRWHQHTRHCTHCQKALATVEQLQGAAAVLGLAAAVALVAQAVVATALMHAGTGLAAAAAAASVPALPSVAAAAASAVTAISSWWQACQAAGVQQGMLVCAVLGVLCLGLYHLLTGLCQKFHYQEYVHALR